MFIRELNGWASSLFGYVATLFLVLSIGLLMMSAWAVPGSQDKTVFLLDKNSDGGPLSPAKKYLAESNNSFGSRSSSLPPFQVIIGSERLKQGEATDIQILNLPKTSTRVEALFSGKTYPLYKQEADLWLGLLPVDLAKVAPGSYALLIRDQTGKTLAKETLTVVSGNFRTQNVSVSKATASLQPEPGELEAVQALKNAESMKRYWADSFSKPVPDCMNSPFGVKRLVNGPFTGNYHKGIDQRSPEGRPVLAIAAGKVMMARQYRLHGGMVGLDHGQGVTSVFIHMSKVLVKPGDLVQRGDVIGKVGSTGFASGPHLHWQLHIHGVPVNPTHWMSFSSC